MWLEKGLAAKGKSTCNALRSGRMDAKDLKEATDGIPNTRKLIPRSPST